MHSVDSVIRTQPERVLFWTSKYAAMKAVRRAALYLTAITLSAFFAFPFLWAVTSSFKGVAETYRYPPVLFPSVIRWENYAEIFRLVPYDTWLLNSVYVTVLSLVGETICACLVGYGFSRFPFPGREIFFMLLLSTMIIPVQVTIIPSYLLFNWLGWIDTYHPLIIPSWIGGSAFSIFLMRQFLMSLPMDFDEAAIMDGAGPFTVLAKVLLPLAKPAITTVAILAFLGNWGNFLGPLIYLNSTPKLTVAVGLRYFQSVAAADQKPMEHLLMGASVIMAAPPVLLFFVAQQYFVRGIVMSGLKG